MVRISRRRQACLMISTILAGATASTAWAQDQTAQQDPVSVLDEIIVTAQKRSESINDVGISIQAFSAEQLEAAGANETEEIIALVPGVSFAKSAQNPIYTMRGVGFNTPNFSSTSPVGVYVNEISYAYPYLSKGPLFDLERVEILKGPQGTLYGRNTTGGLINYITARPTHTFDAGGSVDIGNYESFGVEGHVSGPLTDTLAARFAFRSDQRGEGWQRSVTRPGDRLGEADRVGARASLLWTPTDSFTADASVSWWQDLSDTQAGQAIAFAPDSAAFAFPGAAQAMLTNPRARDADWDSPLQPGPRATTQARPPLGTDSEFLNFTGRMEWEMASGLTLTSLTGYSTLDRRDVVELDGTQFEIAAYDLNGTLDSFSQEVRLSGDFSRGDWILGGYYSRDKVYDEQFGYLEQTSIIRALRFVSSLIPQTQYTPLQIAEAGRNFRNTSDLDNVTMAVFGHSQWNLTEALKLTVAARYTDDELKFVGCSRDVNNTLAPLWNLAVATMTGTNLNLQPNECLTYTAGFAGKLSDPAGVRHTLAESNLSGRVALDWMPSDDLLIYGSVSRGFKSGAFPVLAANVETQLAPAKQEEVLAYEVGAKATLLSGAVQLNGAAYMYDYQDKQLFGEISDPIFTTLTRIVNVPESRVWGAEATLDWQVTEDLKAQVSASYLDTEIQKYEGFTKFGVQQDFAGSAFPYSPEWQFAGQLTYRRPLSNGLELDGVLAANYQSKSQADVEGDSRFGVDGYTLVNASLGIRNVQDGWRVGVWARNLTDKYYWTTVDVSTDVIYRLTGMPRTFGLTVSWALN